MMTECHADDATPVEPPVTLCPPGRRSKTIVARAPVESPIPITTASPLAWPQTPSLVPPAHNDRRSAQERVEAAQRAEAVSVALRQPHRAGEIDPLAGSALGRYCLKRWPGKDRKDIREGRCQAGNQYAQDIDNDRVARGFAPRLFGEASGFGVLTDAQLQERRDNCAKAIADADASIRDICDRAPGVMRRLCWEDLAAGPYDDDVVYHALYRLAVHYKLVKTGSYT